MYHGKELEQFTSKQKGSQETRMVGPDEKRFGFSLPLRALGEVVRISRKPNFVKEPLGKNMEAGVA